MNLLESTRVAVARRRNGRGSPVRSAGIGFSRPFLAGVLLALGSSLGLPAVSPAADRRPEDPAPSADVADKGRQLEALARLDSAPLLSESAVPALLDGAVAALRQGIENGPPFSLTERRSRIARLEKLLGEPNVDVAEKYRRVLEAYRAELDYGKTVEAYRDLLRTEDGERLVDFLSIGRLALYYQTLDGRESGIWRDREKQWRRLSPEYNRAIALGLRAARKLEPPQLLPLPLPGPRSP
ncbi:DUF3450 domain-containing protein [Methylococcus sp. ANG]|uniref:DUF3450 domain-containing protein n=1 Tax=unclassified Methylococcus TaxID=2618889 RepID=UPI001C5328A3|nr:DUF3450 domain-containing protein [Methylococcus sp. Mc7]QXP82618.1 DUF3450 domain-containing protein [Methylococcus sp. Mc7]